MLSSVGSCVKQPEAGRTCCLQPVSLALGIYIKKQFQDDSVTAATLLFILYLFILSFLVGFWCLPMSRWHCDVLPSHHRPLPEFIQTHYISHRWRRLIWGKSKYTKLYSNLYYSWLRQLIIKDSLEMYTIFGASNWSIKSIIKNKLKYARIFSMDIIQARFYSRRRGERAWR